MKTYGNSKAYYEYNLVVLIACPFQITVTGFIV